MNGLVDLLWAFWTGDPRAPSVAAFAVVGTLMIVAAVEVYKRSRR